MTAQVPGVYPDGRVRMRTGEDSGMLEAKRGESEEWKTSAQRQFAAMGLGTMVRSVAWTLRSGGNL